MPLRPKFDKNLAGSVQFLDLEFSFPLLFCSFAFRSLEEVTHADVSAVQIKFLNLISVQLTHLYLIRPFLHHNISVVG